MSKTKRSFVRDDFEDDEVSPYKLHEEKMARKNERLLEKALKTKNIDAFIPEDDDDYIEEMMENGEWEEIEDYVACVECGTVLITEEDQKGAMYFYDEKLDVTSTTCASCLKKLEIN